MRWDSPFALATAGALAIHLAIVTVCDAVAVTHPPRPHVPAPHLELVEIEVPPVLKPPPPPPTTAPEPPAPAPPVRRAPRAHATRAIPAQVRSAPEPTPTPTEAPAPSGGEQVVHMDDIAPAATGVGVAVGTPATGRIGRGGGGGAGAGSGTEIARPVSVATIKTSATPKAGFDYFDAGKDYPAEARALGIEGKIRVRLVVDEHGKVTSRVLLNKLGHGLDELAMRRAAEIEFTPATDTDDHPVTSVVVWTFNMTLPK